MENNIRHGEKVLIKYWLPKYNRSFATTISYRESPIPGLCKPRWRKTRDHRNPHFVIQKLRDLEDGYRSSLPESVLDCYFYEGKSGNWKRSRSWKKSRNTQWYAM